MNLYRRIVAALKIFAGYHLQEYSADRRWWTRASQSTRQDIPYGVRERMLGLAREMERKDPIFNKFLDLCEQYVVGPTGLRITSASANPEWATLANAEWQTWSRFADLSSRRSFGQLQGLIEREAHVAGEVFIHLTFGSSNRPRIQLIEPENIATPPYLTNDKLVFDGVRMDANGRPEGYYIRPADPSAKWPMIESDRIVHLFEPSRINQARGLTVLYPVLKDLLDLSELQDLEMIAAKDAARISKVIKTQTGEVSTEDLIRSISTKSTQTPEGTATTATKADYYKEVIAGESVVLKPGDEYAQFAANRPSPAVQAFWEYVSARAAAGMGIAIEIILHRSLQGTMVREAIAQANAFFRCRAAARAESFGRVWEHVISNTPSLRKSPPVDWRNISYTTPREIGVDVGYNSAAVIAEWKEGFKSLEDIVGPFGKSPEEVLRARARDWKLARDIETQEAVPAGTLLSFDERQAKQQQEQAAAQPQGAPE